MIKLIIWDLDDTLWQGTLADDEDVVPVTRRLEMVRAFNARGVLQSLCSKNDFATVRAKLEALDIWDEFVFPHIAFTPKAQAIKAIIEDMQLRAANVLFVDDNPLNLNAVRHALPDIQIMDIMQADADARLEALLAAQTGTRSRIADYRMLEAKKRDRVADTSLSNEDFLRSCAIRVCTPFAMQTLDHVERIAELINRSNQLNYTKSRVTAEELRNNIIDVTLNQSLAIFAWDKYGDYGLIGFVMVRERHADGRLALDIVHFVFSCRAMHMGMEQFALDEVRRRTPRLFLDGQTLDHPAFEGRFARTPSDWIEAVAIDDPEARARMLNDGVVADPSIRIMWGCQSGGVAHFSDLRAIIEFDNLPKVFELNSFHHMTYDPASFPPYLVYGASTNYGDPSWEGLTDQLESGLYVACVEKLCRFVAASGIEMLVVLPPENLAYNQYMPSIGLTRERIARFNALWRGAFDIYSGLSIVETDLLHGPEEMKDVAHHYPGSLQKIAQLVDLWHAHVTAAQAGQSEGDRQAA